MTVSWVLLAVGALLTIMAIISGFLTMSAKNRALALRNNDMDYWARKGREAATRS